MFQTEETVAGIPAVSSHNALGQELLDWVGRGSSQVYVNNP
jgi:hypothetical protein